MMETHWDEPLTLECSGAALAQYNQRVVGLKPLDRPGTEEFFDALMASLRRGAESRGRLHRAASKERRLQVKVVRSASDALSPQRCLNCGRQLRRGRVMAARHFPVVVCMRCHRPGLSLRDGAGAVIDTLAPARIAAAAH